MNYNRYFNVDAFAQKLIWILSRTPKNWEQILLKISEDENLHPRLLKYAVLDILQGACKLGLIEADRQFQKFQIKYEPHSSIPEEKSLINGNKLFETAEVTNTGNGRLGDFNSFKILSKESMEIIECWDKYMEKEKNGKKLEGYVAMNVLKELVEKSANTERQKLKSILKTLSEDYPEVFNGLKLPLESICQFLKSENSVPVDDDEQPSCSKTKAVKRDYKTADLDCLLASSAKTMKPCEENVMALGPKQKEINLNKIKNDEKPPESKLHEIEPFLKPNNTIYEDFIMIESEDTSEDSIDARSNNANVDLTMQEKKFVEAGERPGSKSLKYILSPPKTEEEQTKFNKPSVAVVDPQKFIKDTILEEYQTNNTNVDSRANKNSKMSTVGSPIQTKRKRRNAILPLKLFTKRIVTPGVSSALEHHHHNRRRKARTLNIPCDVMKNNRFDHQIASPTICGSNPLKEKMKPVNFCCTSPIINGRFQCIKTNTTPHMQTHPVKKDRPFSPASTARRKMQ